MSRIILGKTVFAIFFITAFILSASVSSVLAETRYVSDRLIVSVRDGQDPNAAVLG